MSKSIRWAIISLFLVWVSVAQAAEVRYRFFYQPSTGRLLQVIYTTTGAFADDYLDEVSQQFSLPRSDIQAFEVVDDDAKLEGWRKKLAEGKVPNLPDSPQALMGVVLSPPATESVMDKTRRVGREKLKALGLTEDEINSLVGR